MTPPVDPGRPQSRRRGRPRNPTVEHAILEAAARLSAERGVAALSLTAVAELAGVARATVYRRWPTRDALVGAATKAAVEGRTFDLSGHIARDVLAGAAFAREVVASQPFAAVLPELVKALLADPPTVAFDVVAPNRVELGRIFSERARAQGFETAIPATLPFDLLLGAQLVHLLATGRPPTAEYARQAGEVVVAGLRAHGSWVV